MRERSAQSDGKCRVSFGGAERNLDSKYFVRLASAGRNLMITPLHQGQAQGAMCILFQAGYEVYIGYFLQDFTAT